MYELTIDGQKVGKFRNMLEAIKAAGCRYGESRAVVIRKLTSLSTLL
jgi:hypothetical protein